MSLQHGGDNLQFYSFQVRGKNLGFSIGIENESHIKSIDGIPVIRDSLEK